MQAIPDQGIQSGEIAPHAAICKPAIAARCDWRASGQAEGPKIAFRPLNGSAKNSAGGMRNVRRS